MSGEAKCEFTIAVEDQGQVITCNDAPGKIRSHMYWWEARPNAGDVVGALLYEHITGKKPRSYQGPCALYTVGSLMLR